MQIKIRKLSTRLLVAIVTFTIGVVVTMLWVVQRLPIHKNPAEPVMLNSPHRSEAALPHGWEKLDFNNKVLLWLPPDMKPAEVLGDRLRFTQAYGNSEIHITIMDGAVLLPDLEDKLRKARFYSCDPPEIVIKHPTYNESLIQIDGRQAKLGIARGEDLGGITAQLCFPGADDSAFELMLAANCEDDRALATARQIFSSIRFKK